MNIIQQLLKKKRQSKPKNGQNDLIDDLTKDMLLHTQLKDNITRVKRELGNSSDLVIRQFQAGESGQLELAFLYVDGLIDKDYVQNHLIKSMMLDIRSSQLAPEIMKKDPIELFKSHSLMGGDMKEITSFRDLLHYLLSGDTIILINSSARGFVVGTRGWEMRSIDEPNSQTVVRGPREGFTETLRVNTSLIRRRIKDPSLRLDSKQIGKKTKTDICVVYMKGVASDSIVKEVHKRLDKINIDAILESNYIEELIQDETYTPFPTVYHSERPDAVAAGLLEGRVAIIVDGTPFVLLVPALFIQFFQSSEDYYQRSDIASLIRLLRYMAFFLALLVPSAYIAVTTFHQEMLPTTLLVSLAAQREGVPFPAFFEALLMEITFEILREAGIRMPRAVGSAISIVGALVLGQAAVEAGIVSSAMVIVVSLTAISNFVAPAYNMAMAVRMLRFGFMLLAASFGLFGIILGIIMMIVHLSSLRSFGIPYMSPVAPFIPSDQKDTMLRLPFWRMSTRPRLLNQRDITREETVAPQPLKNNDER